jgi:mpaB/rubber oxygenase-like protein
LEVPVTEQRLPHPPALTAFPLNLAVRLLSPGDIRATPEQLAEFRRFASVGDPLADAVVAMFRELPAGRGRAMFEQALTHGIDTVPHAPTALVDFFTEVDTVPYWLDHDQLVLGARTLSRCGLHSAVLVMPGLSLYGGYLASRADKVLVATGDLDRMAPRRLAETASWTMDVISPGGLDRFGTGFTGVLRVRLMHALVRAGMHRRRDWDYANWDHPVNQVQLAGTLILFSLFNLLGARVLGLRFSRKEKAAVFHLWRYVGHLMGVHHALLPVTEADAWRLMWLEAASEFRPDADSTRLAEAMLSAMPDYVLPPRWRTSRLARWAVVNYVGSFSRLVLGRDNADHLGAPNNPLFQAAVLATTAVTFVGELGRYVVPGATRRRANRGYRRQRAMIDNAMRAHRGDRGYRRHDTLSSASHPAATNA